MIAYLPLQQMNFHIKKAIRKEEWTELLSYHRFVYLYFSLSIFVWLNLYWIKNTNCFPDLCLNYLFVELLLWLFFILSWSCPFGLISVQRNTCKSQRCFSNIFTFLMRMLYPFLDILFPAIDIWLFWIFCFHFEGLSLDNFHIVVII